MYLYSRSDETVIISDDLKIDLLIPTTCSFRYCQLDNIMAVNDYFRSDFVFRRFRFELGRYILLFRIIELYLMQFRLEEYHRKTDKYL